MSAARLAGTLTGGDILCGRGAQRSGRRQTVATFVGGRGLGGLMYIGGGRQVSRQPPRGLWDSGLRASCKATTSYGIVHGKIARDVMIDR